MLPKHTSAIMAEEGLFDRILALCGDTRTSVATEAAYVVVYSLGAVGE